MLKVDEKTLQESWELYKEMENVKLSFTDATCVALAKTHGIPDIFTYNAREFRPVSLNVITGL